MKVLVDTHTHTNCSNHAFGTIWENMKCAKEKGMEMVCMTNHAPAIPDSPHIWHFNTMKELPEYIEGVRLLCGCEANILNSDGEIDMPVQYLKSMDVVVASIHPPCYESKDLPDHTETWLNVVKNPYVNIMGHSGDPRFPYDIDAVVRAAKENNKCIEINNHSYAVRKGSAENCRKIAKKCMEVGCRIVLSSDAHSPFDVGNVENGIRMLEEINFPEELVMNTTADRFIGYLRSVGKDIVL